MIRTHSHSHEETIAFGRELAKKLPRNGVICFDGDLAAGKTTLIKGLASRLNKTPKEHVNSPTFVTLNIYEGDPPIYHFDLYRLKGEEAFLEMGFDDILGQEGWTFIEWPSRIAPLLPEDAIWVYMEHEGECQRLITVEGLPSEKN